MWWLFSIEYADLFLCPKQNSTCTFMYFPRMSSTRCKQWQQQLSVMIICNWSELYNTLLISCGHLPRRTTARTWGREYIWKIWSWYYPLINLHFNHKQNICITLIASSSHLSWSVYSARLWSSSIWCTFHYILISFFCRPKYSRWTWAHGKSLYKPLNIRSVFLNKLIIINICQCASL